MTLYQDARRTLYGGVWGGGGLFKGLQRKGGGFQRGPQKVRCGPATVLQPRLPSHGLHRFLNSLRL
jgi:hypothetical protein